MIKRVFIADDEEMAVQLLAKHVERTEGLTLVGTETDGRRVFERLQFDGLKVDLLLIDVEMPGADGRQIASVLKDRMHVVFVTAHEKYARDGYKLNLAEFLLKPVTYPDFTRMLEKIADRELLLQVKSGVAQAAPSGPEKANLITFTIGAKANEQVYDLNTITHFTSASNHVHVYFTKQPPVRVRKQLKEIESMVSRFSNFMQTHRSYLVNLNHVRQVERNTIYFTNQAKAEVSAKLRETLLNKLGKMPHYKTRR